MIKAERIKELAANPDLINGIYSYCDYWCERCEYTARCMNYAMNKEYPAGKDSEHGKGEALFKDLNEFLELVTELLKDGAAKAGYEIDEVILEEPEPNEELKEKETEDHPCIVSAASYEEMVDAFFISAKSYFIDIAEEMNYRFELGLIDTENSEELSSIRDAVKVIRWYQTLISVKLKHGIKGLLKKAVDGSFVFIPELDGSAKVALLSIDRSLAAWSLLRIKIPELENEIFDLLLHLDRLRKITEQVFPQAREFKRPGFDDGD